MTAEERADKVIDAWSPVSKSLYDILVAEFKAHAREAVERELRDLLARVEKRPGWLGYHVTSVRNQFDRGMALGAELVLGIVEDEINRRLARLGEGKKDE